MEELKAKDLNLSEENLLSRKLRPESWTEQRTGAEKLKPEKWPEEKLFEVKKEVLAQ